MSRDAHGPQGCDAKGRCQAEPDLSSPLGLSLCFSSGEKVLGSRS